MYVFATFTEAHLKMRPTVAIVLFTLALGSCAPRVHRPNAKAAANAVVDARSALRQGCYICLTQAVERLEPFREGNTVARQLTGCDASAPTS